MCDPTEEQEAEFQKNKQITIRKLESENEYLKRERAMLVEALKRFLPRSREQRASETMNSFDNAAFVISATETQATQWLDDKIAEAFNEQAKVWDIIGYSKLRTSAEELRLAASKRKEHEK